ncbi:MAG: hypothetical protein B5M51_05665 [Anaerolinea sp. 4484_236]|nr:MAG: hypothetical protein B5M51_05665 [Anaerolinea sp. 4484_236]
MNEKTSILEQDVSETSSSIAHDWRERILSGLLRGAFIFGLLAAAFAINNILRDNLIPQQFKMSFALLYAAASVLLGAIAFVRRIPYKIRASVLLFLFYGLGIAGLAGSGLSGDGRVFILAFIAMAAILFDMRFSIIALVLGISTLAVSAWLFSAGVIYISPERLANSTSPSSWISGSLVLTLLAVTIIIPIAYLIRSLEGNLQTSQQLLQKTKDHQENLQQLVDERTAVLEYRTRQLQATAEVAHDALSIQDVPTLLTNITDLISKRFDYYHAGIFLLDLKGEYAILQAASSEGGQAMLERGHQLRVGSEGIVGATAAEQRPHIALDTGIDAVFFNNPDLPNTRSEMALPLVGQEKVIGVLDIQSTEAQAFTQQDIVVFQTLADQIALAIENARLVAESRSTVEQLKTIAKQQASAEWSESLKKQAFGYVYTPLKIKKLNNTSANKPLKSADATVQRVKIPINLRGQMIGNIALDRANGKWTKKEQALVADIASQVGLAVENARLLDETREQAKRDHLISQVSSRMRETLDVETVLQTAVREIRKSLKLHDISIQLKEMNENSKELP